MFSIQLINFLISNLWFKGIRSLHFRDYVLSVGTGVGTILFYDVRAKKFLPSDHDAPLIAPNENTPNKNYLKLNTKRGWIVRDDLFRINIYAQFEFSLKLNYCWYIISTFWAISIFL